jgi:hypothetical protein
LPPPEGFINLGEHGSVHYQAAEAIGRLNVYAKDLSDPYILSRILTRREAVSSSAIEGTHSTLDELLSLEETEEGSRSHEVRRFATIHWPSISSFPEFKRQAAISSPLSL